MSGKIKYFSQLTQSRCQLDYITNDESAFSRDIYLINLVISSDLKSY